MKSVSEHFQAAARDYLYLIDSNYPRSTLIKLIGDHYQLSGIERSMLYRGICSTIETCKRKAKLIRDMKTDYHIISIDACNVLITLGSYLNGNTVFISSDHFLRDASEIHGKVFRTSLIERSLNLVIDFLHLFGPIETRFYLDSPISFSGKLCNKINLMLAAHHMHGNAETHPSPDHLLKNIQEGILATSDSAIIDATTLPVTDLARQVLEFHYHPEFCDLSEFYPGC